MPPAASRPSRCDAGACHGPRLLPPRRGSMAAGDTAAPRQSPSEELIAPPARAGPLARARDDGALRRASASEWSGRSGRRSSCRMCAGGDRRPDPGARRPDAHGHRPGPSKATMALPVKVVGSRTACRARCRRPPPLDGIPALAAVALFCWSAGGGAGAARPGPDSGVLVPGRRRRAAARCGRLSDLLLHHLDVALALFPRDAVCMRALRRRAAARPSPTPACRRAATGAPARARRPRPPHLQRRTTSGGRTSSCQTASGPTGARWFGGLRVGRVRLDAGAARCHRCRSSPPRARLRPPLAARLRSLAAWSSARMPAGARAGRTSASMPQRGGNGPAPRRRATRPVPSSLHAAGAPRSRRGAPRPLCRRRRRLRARRRALPRRAVGRSWDGAASRSRRARATGDAVAIAVGVVGPQSDGRAGDPWSSVLPRARSRRRRAAGRLAGRSAHAAAWRHASPGRVLPLRRVAPGAPRAAAAPARANSRGLLRPRWTACASTSRSAAAGGSSSASPPPTSQIASDDGVRQRAELMSTTTLPLNVVLALDGSASLEAREREHLVAAGQRVSRRAPAWASRPDSQRTPDARRGCADAVPPTACRGCTRSSRRRRPFARHRAARCAARVAMLLEWASATGRALVVACSTATRQRPPPSLLTRARG